MYSFLISKNKEKHENEYEYDFFAIQGEGLEKFIPPLKIRRAMETEGNQRLNSVNGRGGSRISISKNQKVLFGVRLINIFEEVW